jgi:outer membrane autotransporter protein
MAEPFGAAGSLSGNGDSHDLNAGTGGVAGGFEQRFDSSLRAGVAFGYAYTGFSTSGIPATGSANTYALAPYARYAPGPWYVEGALGVGYNDAAITRSIVFPGVSRTANGSPSGAAFLSQVETGYRLTVDAQTDVTPFASMQGIVVGQRAFAESGAGAVDLHVGDNTTGSAYGVLGAEIAYWLPVGFAAPVRLNGRLGWAHEFAGTQRTATAFFDGTPSQAPFTVAGASAPRDAAVFGLEAMLAMPSADIYLGYEGAAGDGSSLQGGSAGIRLTF